MSSAHISKFKSNFEKEVILLMIPKKEKKGCNYVAVKNLAALLRGITSKNNRVFFVSIVFILLEQKTNLNAMKKCLIIKILVNYLASSKR